MFRDALVRTETRDGVATISFDRPHKHNAISDSMREQWGTHVEQALGDPEVRCVVLRGEGPSFSSGRDREELGKREGGVTHRAYVEAAQSQKVRLFETSTPVIAALRGHVIGGALEIALMADIRVAAPDVRLSLPEVHHGLVPDSGGTHLVAHLAGPSRAKLMILGGDPVNATTALAWGLVDHVVDGDDLDAHAHALAARIASLPAEVAGAVKRLVNDERHAALLVGLRGELEAQVGLMHRRDAVKGQ